MSVVAQFEAERIKKEINAIQKQITQKKKAKEDADDLLKEKVKLDKDFVEMSKKAVDKEKEMTSKAATIGNIVDKDCHVSSTEVSECYLSKWSFRTVTELEL
jgi:seryl-tRNA synthetase